jgi:hypothetical protein
MNILSIIEICFTSHVLVRSTILMFCFYILFGEDVPGHPEELQECGSCGYPQPQHQHKEGSAKKTSQITLGEVFP